MHTQVSSSASTNETPWGLPWRDLIVSLRPSKNRLALLQSIVEQVEVALRKGGLQPDRVVAGGAFGKLTIRNTEDSLDIFAVFDHDFNAAKYFDVHLKPMLNILTIEGRSPFSNVEEKGYAIHFSIDGIECRLFAAGVLYGGAKDLLLSDTDLRDDFFTPNAIGNHVDVSSDTRRVHIETSCAVIRTNFIRGQAPAYKDLVRVAKKWRDSCKFMSSADMPGDFLIELIMLEAYHGAPASKPCPDFFAQVFRRFLSLLATESESGSDVIAGSDMPKTFLSWTAFYNQGAIDYCIAKGLLRSRTSKVNPGPLCVVDPSVPFIDVAQTVSDWGELRTFARESLSHFQNTELVEVLQTKLQNFSMTVDETLKSLKSKLATLESIEASPRRWSGMIQFNEIHISGDSWAPVLDIELRCMRWRINARRARSPDTGYSRTVDVSLQALDQPTRNMDVDVRFQTLSEQLVFGPKADHILIAKRSEVIRNRDYHLQITIVA